MGAKEQLVVPSSQPMVKSLFEGSDDSDDDLFANLRNQSANQSGVSGKLSRGAQVVSNNDLTAVSNPGASMIADVKSGQSQKPVVGSVTQDLPHAPSKQLVSNSY